MRLIVTCSLLLGVPACGGLLILPDADATLGPDSVADFQADSATHPAPDALVDAAVDTAIDSRPDLGTDSGVAAPPDSLADAGLGCVPPPAGIVSWWPLDGDTRDIVGPNDGVLPVGGSFVAGMVGQALAFDGQSQYLSATSIALPVSNADRSIEMWVRQDATLTEEAFFAGYGDFGTVNSVYCLGTGFDTEEELFFSQWGTNIHGGPLFPAGKWQHAAATNSGNFVKLYLNGVLVSSGNQNIETATNAPFFMGRIAGSLGDTRRLQGAVDEVTVYNRVLSASEIFALYSAGANGKCR